MFMNNLGYDRGNEVLHRVENHEAREGEKYTAATLQLNQASRNVAGGPKVIPF